MGDVEVSFKEGLAFITINRPEVKNALRLQTVEELIDAFRSSANRGDVRAVILRGAGDAFSSGADIKMMRGLDRRGAAEFASLCKELASIMEGINLPVIAAIIGPAIGAGLDLVLLSDIAVASEDAVLGHGGTALGIITPFGGTIRLAKHIGLKVAKEMWFAGRRLSASEALNYGLVNYVVPRERVEAKAIEVAEQIKLHSPLAISYAKRLINMSAQMGYELDNLESDIYARCFETDEQVEGMDAFLERRRPNFS